MSRIRRSVAFIVAVSALLASPAVAHAAIVSNGDFETGNLSGWQTSILNMPGPSNWFAYSGTTSPISSNTIPAPPQGTHAAITDQGNVSRQILYQDVSLPPSATATTLSLIGYYRSSALIVSPDSLAFVGANQQYRIDVMKAGAPIDSVSSGDVLFNVFRTKTGDPVTLAPTPMTANLASFAGQNVRLRFAVVTTTNSLNAGVDAVAIKSNGFAVGTATLNKKKGSAQLPVSQLSDIGTFAASGNGLKVSGTATASGATALNVTGGTVTLSIKPKRKTLRKLNETGKAKVQLSLTYTPVGLSPNTQTVKLKLKKKR